MSLSSLSEVESKTNTLRVYDTNYSQDRKMKGIDTVQGMLTT